MNFNRGDQVVHHSFGVGRVVSIEGRNFTGNRPRLFYRVEFPKTTIWVPVGSPPSRGLRPITPKSQLNHFRDLLTSSPESLSVDVRTRHEELEDRSGEGTFEALCQIVRDLGAWNQKKPLNNFEKALLKRSRASLVEEWSFTSGLAVNETIEEIDSCLQKGKRSLTVD